MRRLFGGSGSDVFQDSAGNAVPFGQGTAWDSIVGGQQITDLADVGGAAIGVITADANGRWRVYGPDDGRDTMWVDAGAGRFLVHAEDIETRVTNLEMGIVANVDLSAYRTAAQEDALFVTSVNGSAPVNGAVSISVGEPVIMWNGSWPLRNTVTNDTTRPARWVGPLSSPPPVGSGYAISSSTGFDMFDALP